MRRDWDIIRGILLALYQSRSAGPVKNRHLEPQAQNSNPD